MAKAEIKTILAAIVVGHFVFISKLSLFFDDCEKLFPFPKRALSMFLQRASKHRFWLCGVNVLAYSIKRGKG